MIASSCATPWLDMPAKYRVRSGWGIVASAATLAPEAAAAAVCRWSPGIAPTMASDAALQDVESVLEALDLLLSCSNAVCSRHWLGLALGPEFLQIHGDSFQLFSG